MRERKINTAILFLIAVAVLSGCRESVNTGLAESEKEALRPSHVSMQTGPSIINDGLVAVDISGITASNFITAGTGTFSRAPETISIEVPAGATVEQVYLYWVRKDTESSPATIKVNDTNYSGEIIGGPVDIPEELDAISYRVNLTGEGIISPGLNTVTVQDEASPSSEPEGASLVIFYSLDAGESELVLFDGIDYLWAHSPGPSPDVRNALRTAEPVTFTFSPEGVERTAELSLFIGDVESEDATERPNSLNITVGDGATVTLGPLPPVFQAFEGPNWDNYVQPVTIPAGVDKVTVQPVSGPGSRPASLIWTLAGLSVPVTPRLGGQGCTPGYWRQSHHYDSWNVYQPEDKIAEIFDIPGSLELKKPEKGKAEDLALGQAIQLRGGGVNALIRHAAAALLNAANPDVQYDLSVGQVIAKFNAAIDGGEIESTKNEFADFNELGCSLN